MAEEAAAKLGRDSLDGQVLCYKTQLVAGTNYFLKVKVGDNECVHARVYKDLQQNVSLHSVQGNKSEDDEIEYF